MSNSERQAALLSLGQLGDSPPAGPSLRVGDSERAGSGRGLQSTRVHGGEDHLEPEPQPSWRLLEGKAQGQQRDVRMETKAERKDRLCRNVFTSISRCEEPEGRLSCRSDRPTSLSGPCGRSLCREALFPRGPCAASSWVSSHFNGYSLWRLLISPLPLPNSPKVGFSKGGVLRCGTIKKSLGLCSQFLTQSF